MRMLIPLLAIFAQDSIAAAEFDEATATMERIMSERSIGAAVLCIAKADSEIVYERGFGHMDRDETRTVPADAIMRVASLAKPVTAAAIRTLVREGRLSLDDRLTELLEIKPHGDPDPRLDDVTIRHLLEHKGGWDRKKSGDPMFRAIAIAKELETESPPSREEIASWVFGQKLDFDPGERKAYSNFGYLLLGRVIERVTGDDATDWIRRNIVKSDDFILARTFPNARSPREPQYFHPGPETPNVFDPDRQAPWPDGGWDSESMDTHGGWAITARAYTDFLIRYWMSGEPRRRGERYSFVFYGSLPGTWSIARQRPDGISWTAIFNQRKDDSGLSYKEIFSEIDETINKAIARKAPASP